MRSVTSSKGQNYSGVQMRVAIETHLIFQMNLYTNVYVYTACLVLLLRVLMQPGASRNKI